MNSDRIQQMLFAMGSENFIPEKKDHFLDTIKYLIDNNLIDLTQEPNATYVSINDIEMVIPELSGENMNIEKLVSSLGYGTKYKYEMAYRGFFVTEWRYNDMLHRIDGPARSSGVIGEEWYFNTNLIATYYNDNDKLEVEDMVTWKKYYEKNFKKLDKY